MAAPSRSINYRKGSGSAIDIDPASYFALLRAMKALPKEAQTELRQESINITDRIIIPVVKDAIRLHTGNYATKLNESIRAGRDRIPKVIIGKKRKPLYSGGANTVMLKYGSIVGEYKTRTQIGTWVTRGEHVQTWASQIIPGWTKTAAIGYTQPAFRAWESEIETIVKEWNWGK